MNHDVLFKQLLKTPGVLRAFFDAFVPSAAPFIDFEMLEFIDKERFTIDGKKRTGDLLVKTRFRGRAAGFLIHLEHQAQRDADLARRMLEYFVLDWRVYALPVYPIAVLSYRRKQPEDPSPLVVDFPNKRVLGFDFDVIDLSRLEAAAYVKVANPAALALAARMRLKQKDRLALAKSFALTLAQATTGKSVKDMVASFFFAYQRLTEGENLQLRREINKVESREMRDRIMQLTNPWIEAGKQEGLRQGLQQGLQKGLQQGLHEGTVKGRQQGEAELVIKQLSRRLGNLSASQEKCIRALPIRKIEALGEALLEFSSRTDLARWLRKSG